jgi:predicted dithiol-disulfide oxidoreductase (DUF899 family)
MTASAENERKGGQPAMHTPPVVSPQAWEAAREQLLVKEKAQTRARDALAAERRRMPWMAVEKAYAFEGPAGKVSLLDLFDGRRQLIVYLRAGRAVNIKTGRGSLAGREALRTCRAWTSHIFHRLVEYQ